MSFSRDAVLHRFDWSPSHLNPPIARYICVDLLRRKFWFPVRQMHDRQPFNMQHWFPLCLPQSLYSGTFCLFTNSNQMSTKPLPQRHLERHLLSSSHLTEISSHVASQRQPKAACQVFSSNSVNMARDYLNDFSGLQHTLKWTTLSHEYEEVLLWILTFWHISRSLQSLWSYSSSTICVTSLFLLIKGNLIGLFNNYVRWYSFGSWYLH